MLRDDFLKPAEGAFAGGVELGFISTTPLPEVAVQYAGKGPGSIFVIDFTMAARGAAILFLSQFPHESELLFPPSTMLQCDRVSQRGARRLVWVTAHVSTAKPDTSGIERPEDMPTAAMP